MSEETRKSKRGRPRSWKGRQQYTVLIHPELVRRIKEVVGDKKLSDGLERAAIQWLRAQGAGEGLEPLESEEDLEEDSSGPTSRSVASSRSSSSRSGAVETAGNPDRNREAKPGNRPRGFPRSLWQN